MATKISVPLRIHDRKLSLTGLVFLKGAFTMTFHDIQLGGTSDKSAAR